MHKSASLPDAWWLQQAIDHGGNVDLLNRGSSLFSNYAPIDFAISNKSTACVETLINARANLNHQNGEGVNPLVKAINNSRYDYVLMLLEAGADYNQKNVIDRSFLDNFRRRGDRTTLTDEQNVYREKVKKWFSDRKAL